ncbi:Protein ccc1 [Datura stramonium]|uniref:Protein ccc1 n=1 Tax=Datura stramonium TaxID=4076 RepID=A0ABS8Y6R5_DATST|nr:Protein ccc1 [Datura stramonium]
MLSNQNREAMESGEEIEIADENEFPSVMGRKYSPVVAHDNDSAVVEMTSFRPGSSSSLPEHDLKKVKVGVHPNMPSEEREESLANHSINGPQRESKLELFGFDSLVNILGLKR